MHPPPIDQIIYNHLFPHPKPTDPASFQALLQRQLVPEVRLETQAFYGGLTTQEAKYPGLDYSHPPHRVRLSRFQWHRRLFRAFDALGLTDHEIQGLTKWEGTRWAKERWEREQGVRIRDTTGDGIMPFVEPEDRVPASAAPGVSEDRTTAQSTPFVAGEPPAPTEPAEEEVDDEDDDGEESDAEPESIGIALNERLMAAVAQRNAGANVAMDEEWEQWLKDAVEAGGIPFLARTGASADTQREIPGLLRQIVAGPSVVGEGRRPVVPWRGTGA